MTAVQMIISCSRAWPRIDTKPILSTAGRIDVTKERNRPLCRSTVEEASSTPQSTAAVTMTERFHPPWRASTLATKFLAFWEVFLNDTQLPVHPMCYKLWSQSAFMGIALHTQRAALTTLNNTLFALQGQQSAGAPQHWRCDTRRMCRLGLCEKRWSLCK